MKVVKYILQAKVIRNGKEETINKNFRHLVNARKYLRDLKNKLGVSCKPLSSNNNETFTTECEGENIKIMVEIKRNRIIKKKKEETQKQ
jgi:hypothetical protein